MELSPNQKFYAALGLCTVIGIIAYKDLSRPREKEPIKNTIMVAQQTPAGEHYYKRPQKEIDAENQAIEEAIALNQRNESRWRSNIGKSINGSKITHVTYHEKGARMVDDSKAEVAGYYYTVAGRGWTGQEYCGSTEVD